MNVKKREITEDEAARDFLTALWDALAVVGGDGQRVTEFLMPCKHLPPCKRGPALWLCTQLDPWTPVARGKVLGLVCELTAGMNFVKCDPKGRGELVLEGSGRTLWVWHNRKAWPNHPGTTVTLRDIPNGAEELSVYGWDGLRDTIALNGPSSVDIQQLNPGETYMFLIRTR